MRLLIATVLAAASVAHAHDPGVSNLEVILAPDSIEARVTANIEDIAAVERSGAPVDATHAIGLRDGTRLIASSKAEQSQEDKTSLRLTVFFPRPASRDLSIRCTFLDHLSAEHRQIFSLKNADGKLLASRLLTRESGWIDLPLSEPGQASLPKSNAKTQTGFIHTLGYSTLLLVALIVCVIFYRRKKFTLP